MKGWDGYVVDPWEANNTLQRLKGHHTKEFVCCTHKVTTLLQKSIAGNRVINFCKCLIAFHNMYQILGLNHHWWIWWSHWCPSERKRVYATISTYHHTWKHSWKYSQCCHFKYTEEAKIMYAYGHKTFIMRQWAGDAEKLSTYIETLHTMDVRIHI